MEKENSYIAFISYRHKPLDREAAIKVQRSIESFVIPREFRDRFGGSRKLGKVFRDEDELPASSSLSESITEALDNSRFLIVICTPDLPQSEWCAQEIQYFLKSHSRDDIIAVLAAGEPFESFSPYLVHDYDEQGNIISNHEPLAANIRGMNRLIDKKLYRREIVRIYAALLGCKYDDLFQREKKRVTNRIIMGLISLVVSLSILGGITTYNNIRIADKNREIEKQNIEIEEQNETITKQNLELQRKMSQMYVDAGINALESFEVRTALEDAIAAYGEGEKNVYDHRVEALISDTLGSYSASRRISRVFYDQSTEIKDILVSSDEKHIYISDMVGYVKCLEAPSGKLLWSTITSDQREKNGDTELFFTDDEKLIIARDNSSLRALSPEDGSEVWSYVYYLSDGVTLRAISHDRKYFAIIDFISGEYHLLVLETSTGKVRSDVPLGLSISIRHDDEWYTSAASFSRDSKLLALAYFASGDEEGNFGNYYAVVDLETGEFIHSYLDGEYRDAKELFYGIHVENGTGNIFCAQYHDNERGIMVTRIDWESESVKRDLIDMTVNDDFFTGSQKIVPMVANDKLSLVFCEQTMLIFDTANGSLITSFEYNGEVVNAFWVFEDYNVVQLMLSDGTVRVYYLENGTPVYNVLLKDDYQQDYVYMAENVGMGLCFEDALEDKGMYVTVGKKNRGRLLAVESVSDETCSVPKLRQEKYHNIDVSKIPGSDKLMVFAEAEELEIYLYDPDTGEMEWKNSVKDHLYYTCVAISEDSFICGDEVFYLDGRKEYVEGITDANEDYYSTYGMGSITLNDGNVLSVTSVTFRDGVYSRYYWINGKKPEGRDSNAINYDFNIYEYGSKFFMTGRNGFIIDCGLLREETIGHAYYFEAFDTKDGNLYVVKSPFGEQNHVVITVGNSTPVFAAMGDKGSLSVFDIKNGSYSTLNTDYSENEILMISFSEDDRYLAVLTRTYLLDIYDLANGTKVFSKSVGDISESMQNASSIRAFSKNSDGTVYLMIHEIAEETYIWLKLDMDENLILQHTDRVMDCVGEKLITRRKHDIAVYPVHNMEYLCSKAREILDEQ